MKILIEEKELRRIVHESLYAYLTGHFSRHGICEGRLNESLSGAFAQIVARVKEEGDVPEEKAPLIDRKEFEATMMNQLVLAVRTTRLRESYAKEMADLVYGPEPPTPLEALKEIESYWTTVNYTPDPKLRKRVQEAIKAAEKA